MEETGLLLRALAFAARKHRDQRRKDADNTPYVNHVIQVANLLSETGKETDLTLLMGAVLHDTVEDTNTTLEELRDLFGQDVADLVAEVTDDKSLPKDERKRLQIVNAPHKSLRAKKLKLADKICNVRDIISSPPADWSIGRKIGYLDWAEQVAVGLAGSNEALEKLLRQLIAEGRTRFK